MLDTHIGGNTKEIKEIIKFLEIRKEKLLYTHVNREINET